MEARVESGSDDSPAVAHTRSRTPPHHHTTHYTTSTKQCGVLQNLLMKEHTHTFCNNGGDVRELDFRFFLGQTKIGAPLHGLKAFFTTPQLEPADKLANAPALGTSPIVRSLIDPEGGMRDVRALDDVSFFDWFTGHGGSVNSIERMWDPIGEFTYLVFVGVLFVECCCLVLRLVVVACC